MKVWHILGVDPGLVHTGVVRLLIGEGSITISHTVVPGLDAETTDTWIRDHAETVDRIFVEKYDPRQHYGTDERMIKGEVIFKKELRDAVFLRNFGIKKIVSVQMLDLMGLWNFNTSTHHQDLRSAARIAVLGMMKDPQLNLVLADMLKDALANNPWTVTDLGGGVAVALVTQ